MIRIPLKRKLTLLIVIFISSFAIGQASGQDSVKAAQKFMKDLPVEAMRSQ